MGANLIDFDDRFAALIVAGDDASDFGIVHVICLLDGFIV
jgi:hypothetical protein